MTMQELWQIKENLSEKFWGKSADEINSMIEPSVKEISGRIAEIQKQKAEHSGYTAAS